MNDDERFIYETAISQWGKKAQVGMCIEECGELIVALAKSDRNVNGATIADILDELVDVQIMIEQMQVVFKIDEQVFAFAKATKLNRLIDELRLTK